MKIIVENFVMKYQLLPKMAVFVMGVSATPMVLEGTVLRGCKSPLATAGVTAIFIPQTGVVSISIASQRSRVDIGYNCMDGTWWNNERILA